MSDLFQLLKGSILSDSFIKSQRFMEIPMEKILPPDPLICNKEYLDLNKISTLAPLTVYEKDGEYQLIDGHKRLLKLLSLHKSHCFCIIVNSFSDSKLYFLLRIFLNQNRPLSFREKYNFLSWLKENYSKDEYLEAASLLPLSQRERHEIEQLFGASEVLLSHIESGKLDSAVVPELINIDEVRQREIIEFLSNLQFSRSAQRELIEWLPEIASRKNCTITSIADSSPIQGILNHNFLNPPQKMQKIRDHLFNERFPVLSKAKSEWTEVCRKINPDSSHIQFIADDSFEKNRLEIKINVSNPQEVLSIFEKLKNIPSDQWEKLIYPAKNFFKKYSQN